MTGKRLLKRVALALALGCGVFLFFAALDANATPIRPDIRKIVTEPPQDTAAQSMPARAGWDGPEMPPVQTAGAGPLPSSTGLARAERAELIAAATPDPRAVLGIAGLIFLLRLLRRQEEKRARATVAMIPASDINLPAAAEGEGHIAA